MLSLAAIIQQQSTAAVNNSFVTTWRTTAASESITLPLVNVVGFSHNFEVDWGDSSSSTITAYNDADRVHVYANSGDYDVTITGAMPGFSFNNGGDKLKLREVKNWGQVGLKLGGMAGFLWGCVNMTCSATDTPDISAVTSLLRTFNTCSLFNADLSGWDTSSVTDMTETFAFCSVFNGNISTWQTPALTSLNSTFYACVAFNQDISGWDTADVTYMGSAFRSCTVFNQNISGWNTDAVTNMSTMFLGCTSLDQSFSSWNVGALTNATQMFHLATLSTTNYSNTLIGWAAQTLTPSVPFHGGLSKYNAGGLTARNTLTSSPKLWTITDGGAA